MRMNHAYCDGVSWLGTLNAFSSNPIKDSNFSSKNMSFSDQLKATLMTPYWTLKAAYDFLESPVAYNAIKKGLPEKKHLEYRISEDIDLIKFKNACKRHNTKVTPASHALLGKSLKEYFLKRKD